MNFFRLSSSEFALVKKTEEENAVNNKKAAKFIFLFFNIPVVFLILTQFPMVIGNGLSGIFGLLPIIIIIELMASIFPVIILTSSKNKLKKLNEQELYGIYGVLKSKEVRRERYRSNGKTRHRTVYYFHIEIDGIIDTFKVNQSLFNNKREEDKILIVNFYPDKPLVPNNCECY